METKCKMRDHLLTGLVIMLMATAFCLAFSLGESSTAYAGEVTAADEEQLRAAVEDAAEGDIITVEQDIAMENILEIPAGKNIILQGKTGSERLTVVLSKSTLTSAQKSSTYALLTVKGTLTVKNIAIDAGGNLRTMCISGAGSCTLDKGAVITGGQIGKTTKINGAGITMVGSNTKSKASLIINDGASVTGNRAYGEQTVNGIGIYGGAYSEIIMNGGTVSDNRDLTQKNSSYYSNGGGIALDSYAYLTMNGGTVCDNFASGGGGGIFQMSSVGGVAINSGASIKNNTTATCGGGLYVMAGTATMNGGTISGNSATTDNTAVDNASGGGVYVEGEASNQNIRGRFVLNGGTISSNKAYSTAGADSGEVQVAQGGGVMTCGDFEMNGGVISGNTADSKYKPVGIYGYGGGVAVGGGPDNGVFTMTGGQITGNSAGYGGGGVYADNETISTNSTSIVDSRVHSPGCGQIIMRGKVTVKSNSSAGKADNIYLTEENTVKIADSLETGSAVYLNKQNITDGTAVAEPYENYDITNSDARYFFSNDGRQIYSRDSKGNITAGTEKTYIDFSGAVIGGVNESYVYTGGTICPQITVTLDGKTLKEGEDFTVSSSLSKYDNINVSTDEKCGAVKVFGIGEYAGDVVKEFRIIPKDINSDDIVIGEIADQIYFGDPSTPLIRMSGPYGTLISGEDYTLRYSDNETVGTASVIVEGLGNYTGSRTISFNIVENSSGCTAVRTGEELIEAVAEVSGESGSSVPVYIISDVVLNDTVTAGKGSNISLIGYNGAVISAGSSMSSLIEAESGSRLTITDLTLDSELKGRALFVNADADVSIVNTVIRNGRVLSAGDTQVDYSGGGIYNAGNLTGCNMQVESNMARNGAGIFNAASGTVEINDSIISGNTASLAGGGIYNLGNLVLGEGTSVSANEARRATESVTNGAGGGIYNGGKLTICEKSAITDNNAGKYGGGIYTVADVVMDGGNIDSNIVRTEATINIPRTPERRANCGGGVYIESGCFTMNDGTISGNTVKSTYTSNNVSGCLGCGGGVFVNNSSSGQDAVFAMNGGSIDNNRASALMKNEYAGNGGGIYAMGGDNTAGTSDGDKVKPAAIAINGGTVTGNDATSSGDGIFMGNKEFYIQAEISYKYAGPSDGNIGGPAVIAGNTDDNMYMMPGVELKLTGPASGGTIGVTAVDKGDKTIASGTSAYQATDSDAEAFVNDTGIRTVVLKDNEIVFKAVDITGLFNVKTAGQQYTYTGKEIKPAVTVTDSSGNVYTQGADYEVSYSGKRVTRGALIDAGVKKAIVTGTGDYCGHIEAEYKVVPRSISSAKASLKSTTLAYTGKALQPAISSITYNSIALLKGTSGDYTVSYKNNTNTGKASLVITGRGNFTGTKTLYFKIVPKKATVSKLTSPKKKYLKVTWKKDTKATGYQVVIAKNSKFTSGKKTYTVTSYKTVSKTISKLTSKKYYYVKVRAYKTISGVKCYGAYSSVKKIKVK